jgi:hypothetical protein
MVDTAGFQCGRPARARSGSALPTATGNPLPQHGPQPASGWRPVTRQAGTLPEIIRVHRTIKEFIVSNITGPVWIVARILHDELLAIETKVVS